MCVCAADQADSETTLDLTSKEKMEGLSVEIEENLDWCIDLLQTMNSKKTAGQMAQEQVCISTKKITEFIKGFPIKFTECVVQHLY